MRHYVHFTLLSIAALYTSFAMASTAAASSHDKLTPSSNPPSMAAEENIDPSSVTGILGAVSQAIARTPSLQGANIGFEVAHYHEVTLVGTVVSEDQIKTALDVVKKVPYVKEVKSKLVVKKGG